MDSFVVSQTDKRPMYLQIMEQIKQRIAVGDQPAHGGSVDANGAAIAGGTVFVNSGYNQWGGMPGNVLLAFSVDGK